MAAVFATAALAKLADRRGFRQSVVDFGVPAGSSAAVAWVVPLLELGAAVALVPAGTAPWGSAACLVLLVLFAVGIAANLAKGRRPPCHCFGQSHAAPIGWPTLGRNGVLASLAAFVTWQGWDRGGQSVGDLFESLRVEQIVWLTVGLAALGVIVLQGWMLFGLLRQHGRLLLRVEALEGASGAAAGSLSVRTGAVPTTAGLPIGTPAPDFDLPDLDGRRRTLASLRSHGKPMVLLFTDAACAPCAALMAEVARWQRDHGERLTVALISAGSAEANLPKAAAHRVRNVLVTDDSDEVARAYRYRGTPGAVLVDARGLVASAVAAGADEIRALVSTAATSPPPPHEPAGAGHGRADRAAPPRRALGDRAAPVGSAAKAVRGLGLSGETVDLSDFLGHHTLVVFFNPGCGFCRQLLPGFKRWEATAKRSDVRVLLVSSGTVDDNRALGLQSSVVLDEGFEIGRSYGATGTPTAVVVDRNGNVASPIAEGVDGVMELARSMTREHVLVVDGVGG